MKFIFILIIIFTFPNFTFAENTKSKEDIKTLKIQWQRLVDEKGNTCQRCSFTEEEMGKAVDLLTQSLKPLKINVLVEKKVIHPEIFLKDTSQSNSIMIGEKPLHIWLNAKVGKTLCGTTCTKDVKNVKCRTLNIKKTVYEAIPTNLIVKAGLIAASELLTAENKEALCKSSSCMNSEKSSCDSKTDKACSANRSNSNSCNSKANKTCDANKSNCDGSDSKAGKACNANKSNCDGCDSKTSCNNTNQSCCNTNQTSSCLERSKNKKESDKIVFQKLGKQLNIQITYCLE